MANESLGNHPIAQAQLFPWNQRRLTSLLDEKGNYCNTEQFMDDELTIDKALDQADAHIERLNATQMSPTFPAEFYDPHEDDEDEDEQPIAAEEKAE